MKKKVYTESLDFARDKLRRSGFTLVELLIAVTILATVGGMAVVIIFTTLRGANKADIMREVKQNGDYALETMTRLIRNANLVAAGCPETSGTGEVTSIEIENVDGGKTTFLTEQGDSLARIASSSGGVLGSFLTSEKVAVSNLRFTCTRTGGNKPDVISISFDLSQAQTTTRPEERAAMNFQTTVSLRTY